MSSKTLYEGPEGERHKASYQTYDERSVSRGEISRALRRANFTLLWSRRWVRATGIGFAVIAIALVIWVVYPLVSLLISTRAQASGSTLVTTAGISLPFQGAAIAIFMLLGVPLIVIVGVYLNRKRM